MKWRVSIGSSILDAITGAYLFAATVDVIIPEVLGSAPSPWSTLDTLLTLVTAVFAMLIGGLWEISLGAMFVRGGLPSETNQRGRLLTQHLGWFTLVVSILAGWIYTEISPIEFLSGNGLNGAGRIFKALLTPNFDIIVEALNAMIVTVFTAFMATIIAVPLSFLLAFPAARNVMSQSSIERGIYSGLRAILNITRSMEPIIWAIIFSVWVGIGPFAGMLALVIHTISSLAKQYSEQIEDVDNGPIEAISATGANRIQVLWFAVVPQCVIPFLSFTIYRWDINVRMATIIGFVGGGGIGTLLTQYQGVSKFHEVGTLVIVITAVVWILDVASARIREALK